MFSSAFYLYLATFPILLITSCMVGPDYQKPSPKLEAAFKNVGFEAPAAEGSWWKLFREPELDRLIQMSDRSGRGVASQLARFDRARAALGLARADAYPAITADAFATRQRDSNNSNFSFGTFNEYRSALNLDWEIDLWGRVRRRINAAEAELAASGYEFQGLILSLRGEVARTYISLRFADAEMRLLEQTKELRAEAQRLTTARFEGGVSSKIDQQRAVTEYQNILSELSELKARRQRLENALAALTGRSAAGFTISSGGALPQIPAVPSAVPSDLLRRRPDLAAAERRLAVASESVGVAIASYLPRLSITGEGGFRSLSSSELFQSSSKLWSLGPELALPIFQGGRGFSDKARAEAAYREALGNYRDQLLTAVRETEDSLGDSRYLATAAASRKKASAAAAQAAALTRKRYDQGVTDYFEVVDADRTSLNQQRQALNNDLDRALAATRLIQALGGGWKR